jgi:acyl-CoA synthetase (AMP-forming)/AMP-acid ligase II
MSNIAQPVAHPRTYAQISPEKPALIMADSGRVLTYRELIENADRAAQAFQRLGLLEGDIIAIFIENQIRYPELCWAAKNSGITYVCICSQLNVDDAVHIVKDCGAKLMISSLALAEVAQGVAEQVADIHYVMIDGVVGPFKSYEKMIGAEQAVPLNGRRRGPSMLYSSGTTGRPKGVRTPLPNAPPETPPGRFPMLIRQYAFSPETMFVNPGPFYHAGPLRFMMSIMRAGGTVVGFRKFDPLDTLHALHHFKATHALFVPTMFSRMLALPQDVKQGIDTSSLRFAIHAAAPCSPGVKQSMIDWWGPIICELYAGTEAVGHTFINSEEWLAHKGSVGRPAHGCRMRIVDEQGHDLPPFAPGLIYMSNGLRFEYHNDPDKTREVRLDDQGEWVTLGDIGYADNDGYLYLTDRHSHMIISGGVNIYPQEAEHILADHPAVIDVAVIGIPNDDFGEEVKAVVQPEAMPTDAAALEAELIAYCRARLSAIKCPRSIDFVPMLPRSEMGKLLKRELKKKYWEGRDSLIV